MANRLREVLLIDDDQIDNMLHKRVISGADCCERIVEFQYAEEALTYLRDDIPRPVDLIFLDINMPRMSGFEFIEAYENLDDERRAMCVVVMLTTSLNAEDQGRAESSAFVDQFLNKPLTTETFRATVGRHFPSIAVA